MNQPTCYTTTAAALHPGDVLITPAADARVTGVRVIGRTVRVYARGLDVLTYSGTTRVRAYRQDVTR